MHAYDSINDFVADIETQAHAHGAESALGRRLLDWAWALCRIRDGQAGLNTPDCRPLANWAQERLRLVADELDSAIRELGRGSEVGRRLLCLADELTSIMLRLQVGSPPEAKSPEAPEHVCACAHANPCVADDEDY